MSDEATETPDSVTFSRLREAHMSCIAAQAAGCAGQAVAGGHPGIAVLPVLLLVECAASLATSLPDELDDDLPVIVSWFAQALAVVECRVLRAGGGGLN